MEASDRVRSFSWASRLPVCCTDEKKVLAAAVMLALSTGGQAGGKPCAKQSRSHWKLGLQAHFITWGRDWGTL